MNKHFWQQTLNVRLRLKNLKPYRSTKIETFKLNLQVKQSTNFIWISIEKKNTNYIIPTHLLSISIDYNLNWPGNELYRLLQVVLWLKGHLLNYMDPFVCSLRIFDSRKTSHIKRIKRIWRNNKNINTSWCQSFRSTFSSQYGQMSMHARRKQKESWVKSQPYMLFII